MARVLGLENIKESQPHEAKYGTSFGPRNTFGQGRLSARLPLNGKSLGGSMHLGLARAQLLPRSDG
uniref:hypothetical protein n=1 Tax=Paenacidovorax caeni TaxID=343013 RepID=UPI000AAE5285